MRKIISPVVSALLLSTTLVFAQTPPVPTSSATTNTSAVSEKMQASLACVQTAVDAREQTINTAFTAFSTAESSALSARATALHDAWGLTDSKARRTARQTAWDTFRTANKNAFTALRTVRKSAWATFETASKTCHASVVESPKAEGIGSLGL